MNYIPRALTKGYRKRLKIRLEEWTGSHTPITINDALTLLWYVEMLEKEADWLAEVICKKHSDIRRNGFVPDCPIDRKCNNQCVQCWREAARKAVEKENETHKSQTDEAQER